MDPDQPSTPEPPQPEPPRPEPAEPRSSRRGDLPLTAAIVLAVALAFALGFVVGDRTHPGGEPLAAASIAPSAAADSSGAAMATATVSPSLPPLVAADDPTAGLPADGSTLGAADAPVTIEVWSDFQCPYCGHYARDLEPWLIETYVVPGTVRLAHRDLAFIGPESLDAAVLARFAAGEGRFWPVYELLFANQSGENKGAFSRDRLLEIAVMAGLDRSAAAAAFDDASLRAAVVDEAQSAIDAGINSTPTIVINGQKFGAGVPSQASLSAAIEALAGGG